MCYGFKGQVRMVSRARSATESEADRTLRDLLERKRENERKAEAVPSEIELLLPGFP